MSAVKRISGKTIRYVKNEDGDYTLQWVVTPEVADYINGVADYPLFTKEDYEDDYYVVDDIEGSYGRTAVEKKLINKLDKKFNKD